MDLADMTPMLVKHFWMVEAHVAGVAGLGGNGGFFLGGIGGDVWTAGGGVLGGGILGGGDGNPATIWNSASLVTTLSVSAPSSGVCNLHSTT